ncbi:MAG TPA: hypothetical protein VN701_02425 [Candidatus Paceibacterota bacterium]|nr:hypothetical protein [Candidatus Paceibacterota bacterium]
MRYLLPLILIAAAIGLFVVYTNPTYQVGIKSLKDKEQSYDDALNKSQELKSVRDQLLSKYNTFSADDKQKLQDMLPDNVDNIRLVIDINNIAARHGLAVKNLNIGDTLSTASARSAAAVGASGSAVGSVELGFAVSADYDGMLAFLYDLEHSLRLIDVEKISFTENAQTNLNDYSLTIRTYWLH